MTRTRFVVITSSRTGSTWLMDVLNGHAGVEAHGELFLDHGRTAPAISDLTTVPRFVEVYARNRSMRFRNVFSYLDELYRRPNVIGFKLMYSQLRSYPEIMLFLALHRVRIVHLQRLNHIDVLVSEAVAKITGVSHIRAGLSSEARKVHLDAEMLRRRLNRMAWTSAAARRLIRVSTCPVLEVTYEALLDGHWEFERIQHFLEISAIPTALRSKLSKRGTVSHRDAIENYDEVTQALAATRFSDMLR